MNENFERLNRIYPNGKYVLISPYDECKWENTKYDSKLDNKSPLNRWNSRPLSYEDACLKIDEGYRIGWVVPKGYIVIDIDNVDDYRAQEYIEKILTKFEVKYSYNYTFRGIHILFKDPNENIKSNSKVKCALNIEVDSRANETGYIILPINDPHREWGEWNDFVEDIPYFLKPLSKEQTPSFIGMSEGDGRNDALFKWRSRLEASNKLNTEEIEKSIRIINEYLFNVAIPNNELFKTVLRDKEKKKVDPTEKENPYNKIADALLSRYDIINYAGSFYLYNGSYYKEVDDIDIEKLVHNDISKNLSSDARREILSFIRLKSDTKHNELNKEWYKICCRNGILNLITGELTIPTKTDLNTIAIPWNYNDNPDYSPRIDQFMKEISGGDLLKMRFLYQIAGYCLLKKNHFEKFFVFKGEGCTGKSTYTNLLAMMCGSENTSHIGLCDFDKDYYLSSTINKLVNIDDDVVDGKRLEYTGRFKSFVSGETISARRIYRDVINFKPYATLVFSCNRLPQIMDKTSGLYRRIVLIELNHKVLKPDPMFMQKITEMDMEYFLFKAASEIKIALDEGKLCIMQSEEELLEQFRRRQSPLFEFLYEHDVRLKDLLGKTCKSWYSQFSNWCDEAGYNKKLTLFSFKEDVCTQYKIYVDMADKNSDTPGKMIFKIRGNYDPEFKPF